MASCCVPYLCCLAVVAEFGNFNIIVITTIFQLWAHWFHILVVPWAVMEVGVYGSILKIGLYMLCVIGLMHTTSFTSTWVRHVLVRFLGQLPGYGIYFDWLLALRWL